MSTEPLTPEQIEELKKRHIRSFCMRRGHISNAQEKALEELLPLYEIPYDANQMFDAVKTFGNNNPLVRKSAAAWAKPLLRLHRLILKSISSAARYLLPASAP